MVAFSAPRDSGNAVSLGFPKLYRYGLEEQYMELAKNKGGIFLLVIVLSGLLSWTSAWAEDACKELSWSLDRSGWSSTLVLLKEDGTFYTLDNEHGTWETFGKAWSLDFTSTLRRPLYAGTYYRGFFKYTDGSKRKEKAGLAKLGNRDITDCASIPTDPASQTEKPLGPTSGNPY
jgi:hypothetical protein